MQKEEGELSDQILDTDSNEDCNISSNDRGAKVWLRLETGGVMMVLALLPLMPILMVVLLIVFSLVLGLVAWMVRGTRRYLDQRTRVPCGHCSHAVRPEASVCAVCGEGREPTALLNQPGALSRGWAAAVGYVRDRRNPSRLATAGR